MNRARTILSQILGAAFCLSLVFMTYAQASESPLENAARLEQSGDFKQAAAVLQKALENLPVASAEQRKQLEFELDRLERIKKDFPLTEEALASALKKSVRGLTPEETARWIAAGWFDSRTIDGRRYFMVSSIGNLFWRHPELSSRRLPRKDTRALEKRLLATAREIKQAARARKSPYVLPRDFDVTMQVEVKSNAVPDGETIRAWLPIPREYPFQTGFRLLSASGSVLNTDSPESPIRSICLQTPAHSNQPTEFQLRYQYETKGVWFDVKPDQVRPLDHPSPDLEPFIREAPHIVFTPEMRALAQHIAGKEPNPYRKAKLFYEWIGEHIQYSYALEYSTIPNIGEYCRRKGYGDCGQEALLFMTLCRLSGIPARWQSGWNTFPGAKSIHDWTEIYLAPYGWIPVDPYEAIFATQYSPHLTQDERRELRDFYFGGLDPYRMIANSDHNQVLRPAKRALRSDNVDFQRGELEWGDHNIYFDQYSCDLTIKPARQRLE